MRILKQVLSVALNDDGGLGAWEGSADYDGSAQTVVVNIMGIAPDRAHEVLDAIESAVAYAVRTGTTPLEGSAPPDGAAARVAQSAMSAMAAGTLKHETAPHEALPVLQRAAMPPAPDALTAEVPHRHTVEDRLPMPQTSVPPSAADAATETAPSESADGDDDEIAKAIDKAAKHKHAAEGSISLISFTKLCAEHDEKARAELDASMDAGAGCAATKAHVDRNSGYFPAYASKDDATRASRLIHTMRGIVSIKSQTS